MTASARTVSPTSVWALEVSLNHVPLAVNMVLTFIQSSLRAKSTPSMPARKVATLRVTAAPALEVAMVAPTARDSSLEARWTQSKPARRVESLDREDCAVPRALTSGLIVQSLRHHHI